MMSFLNQKFSDITIQTMQILITADYYQVINKVGLYLFIPQYGAVEWYNDAPDFLPEAKKFLNQFKVPKRL